MNIPQNPNGQATMANSEPVVIASNQTSIPVTLAAGSAIVGNVSIDQTTPGTTNGVQVNAALPAGNNNIGDVDVASSALPTGASTSANQTSEIALLTTIDGDTGNISTKIDTLAGAVAGAEMQVDVLTMPSVTVTATNLDIRDLTFAADKVDASGTVLGAGTNNIGDVDVVSSALPTGAATLAEQQTQTASLSVLDDWDNAASDGASVSGDVAHDSADAGEPVKIGGKALSADPTAVTTADRVNALFDLLGKQVVLPYAIPESAVSGAITSAMTGTTSTSLVAAPGAGLRNYITQITISNSHAAVGTDVIIQDGSGGTTLYTIPAAALYGGGAITFPTPLRQPTTNTALYCANVTTGASTKASASGFKAP